MFQIYILFVSMFILGLSILQPEDLIEIRKLIISEIQETNGNISGINSLNENYNKYQTFINELNNVYGKEDYNMFGVSFIPIESLIDRLLVNNDDLIFGQIIVSFSDFDNEIKIGDVVLKNINDTDLFQILSYNVSICVFNFLIDTNENYQNIICTPNTNQENIILRLENKFISGNTSHDIFDKIINNEDIVNHLRIGLIKTTPDKDINKAINLRLQKILESLSISCLRIGYFAILDMTQQEVLDSIEISDITNPVEQNLVILNKEINEINNRLLNVPEYVSGSTGSFYISYNIFDFNLNNDHVYCNVDDIVNNEKGFYKTVTQYSNQCLDICYNTPETCTRPLVIKDLSCGNHTNGYLNLPLYLNISNQIIVGKINLKARLDVIEDANIYNTKGALNFIWNIDIKPITQNYGIDSTTKLEFSFGNKQPQIINEDESIEFILKGNIDGNLIASKPIIIERIINDEEKEYILRFNTIRSTKLNSRNFISTKTRPLKFTANLEITCDFKIVCKDIMTFIKDGITYDINYSLYKMIDASDHALHYCRESSIDVKPKYVEMNIPLYFAGAYNETIEISNKENNNNWIRIPKKPLPVSVINEDVSNIEYSLNKLASQVGDINERVISLEDASQGPLETALELAGIFIGVADLASNLFDKIKYFNKMVKPIRQTMAKGINTRESSLANEFSKVIKERGAISSKYNPIDSINQATPVSYQTNLAKSSWRNNNLKSKDTTMLNWNDIVSNLEDLREISQINPSIYLQLQQQIARNVKLPPGFDKLKFGEVNALASPIEHIPVLGKFLHGKAINSEGAKSFLSNTYQRYPFHTSVYVKNFELEDKNIVLNLRYSGVAEPSVVGPTNAKNPRVKLGYVKFQYELNKEDLSLKLRNWDKTKINKNTLYTESDVNNLYTAFGGPTDVILSTDQKWTYINAFNQQRIKSRNVIDSIALPNDIFLNVIDDLLFFDKRGNSFKYNLLNNNCQTFVKVFSDLVTGGFSSLKLQRGDFNEYVKLFIEKAKEYKTDYTRWIRDDLYEPFSLYISRFILNNL